jgi:hypothetical protein
MFSELVSKEIGETDKGLTLPLLKCKTLGARGESFAVQSSSICVVDRDTGECNASNEVMIRVDFAV